MKIQKTIGLGIAMLGIIPFGHRARGLCFHEPEGGRGGSASFSEDELEDMPEGKFRAKVLGAASAASTKMAEIKKEIDTKIDGWQAENKKAVEDLTMVKNQLKDNQEITQSLKKVLDAREREYSLATASLSPVRRIQSDPKKRAAFNLMIRLACDRQDLTGAIEVLRKDLNSGSTPGSTMIDEKLLPEIYDTLATYGIWNTLAVRRLSSKTTHMPVKTARVVAKWVDEAAAIDPDNAKQGTATPAVVKKAGALVSISRELLQDAEFDVTADVLDDFAEAIAFRFDHAAFVADGTADDIDGGFTGVFEAGLAAVAGAGNTSVEELDFEDFLRCLTTVAPVVLRRLAKWWMHPTQIARSLAVRDGNGRPMFLTALEAPTFGGVGSILGYPVVPGFALPSANVPGSKVAAFGDPSGHVVGVRQDIEVASSDHFAFNTDERAFRAIARAAFKNRRADAFAVLTLPGA